MPLLSYSLTVESDGFACTDIQTVYPYINKCVGLNPSIHAVLRKNPGGFYPRTVKAMVCH